MKLLILFCFLFPLTGFAYNQDSLPLKKKVYKVNVYDQHSQKLQGYLQGIGDSTIFLANTSTHFGAPGKGEPIQYSDLSSVTIKRKGSATRGAILGAVGGFLIGAIIGYASGDDPVAPANEDFFGLGNAFRLSAGQKAIGGGLMLAAAGAAVGGVTGALVKKRFIIRGRKENFDAMRMQTIENIYAPSKH